MAGLTAVIADLARSRMPAGMPMQVHRLVAAGVDTAVLGHPRTTDSRDAATAGVAGPQSSRDGPVRPRQRRRHPAPGTVCGRRLTLARPARKEL